MMSLKPILVSASFLGLVASKAIGELKSRQAGGLAIYERCRVGSSFSLTFDDGPGPLSQQLNQLLDQQESKATFFVNGNNAACVFDHADEMKERFQQGHLLGNHGWSHAHMTTLSREEMISEVKRVDDALYKIVGVKPAYFRPPYGEYNDQLREVLSEMGYKGIILWSKDSDDSHSPAPSADQIISTYQSFQDKEIVLNHEISRQTVEDVMPQVVSNLKQKGYSLQTAAQCLDLGDCPSEWYRTVGQPSSRDETWVCS